MLLRTKISGSTFFIHVVFERTKGPKLNLEKKAVLCFDRDQRTKKLNFIKAVMFHGDAITYKCSAPEEQNQRKYIFLTCCFLEDQRTKSKIEKIKRQYCVLIGTRGPNR